MDSKNVLITGATGNVGYETIRGLHEIKSNHQVVAGNIHVEKTKNKLSEFNTLQCRKLDFADKTTFTEALEGIDVVFLMRPPQLADVHRYFEPFVDTMIQKNIKKIVFLSVQGVENQKLIPHHKIEKLIRDKPLDFAFLRPGYFMQNLTNTLVREIKEKNKIFIPSGNLKFNWVDARDIGLVAAHVLNDFEQFKNDSYEITGTEFTGFKDVASMLTDRLGRNISYESPNLLRFYLAKKKQGISKAMIFVMIMLHFLPRFGKNEPRLTETVKIVTGKNPILLKDFIEREKSKF